MKTLKNFLALTLFIIFATACKSDQTEEYFVKASESADFFVVNIPASIVELDKQKLDAETLRQIQSIKKANLLLYKNDYDQKVKKLEYDKAKKIIKGNDYKTLTKIKTDGYSMSFAYQGDPNKIDKVIFLGNDKDYNFLFGLIKAKDVNINSFIKAIRHIKKIDESQAKEVMKMIKPNE